MKVFLRRALKIILAIILAFFLMLAAGFFAVRFGWTNTAGEENSDSSEYNQEAKKDQLLTSQIEAPITSNLPNNLSIYGAHEIANRCKLAVAVRYNDYNAAAILRAYQKSRSEALLDRMLLALKLRLPNRDDFGRELKVCENGIGDAPSFDDLTLAIQNPQAKNLFAWQSGEPWQIIKEAVIKDQQAINDASLKAGVQPRLLLSVAIVEQLRLYYTQRELFEKVFKPLKILANANKMAWGVMSIKEKMAISTEENLKDSQSDFYPGNSYRALLDFPASADIAKERYSRLTNEHDHFYSYLYGALIIKELEAQWLKAGYHIDYRPEIIATLFNIGFNHSVPKENPVVGGSTIEIEGEKYFFGSLAYEFYYSGELSEEFPFD
ncbi:MAG: hypothetical protein NT165_01505 [Candidatus Falkowbacteria bacterium]|nr:hypothetical protein [Candidatus Falkowbacteria bacterium]